MAQAKEEKMSKRPKTITLQYLLKENLPVWVRNNTGDPEQGKSPGVIVFQVVNGPDRDWGKIPPGNDPVCLTDQVDPISLNSCRDLFKLIDRGALELLDPDKAEEYYELNRERKKIMRDKLDKYTKKIPQDVPRPAEIKVQHKDLHPRVGDICLKAKHGAITERDALERLIEQSKVFTEDEYQYIAANGSYAGIKAWAKEQLHNLYLQETDPVEAASKR